MNMKLLSCLLLVFWLFCDNTLVILSKVFAYFLLILAIIVLGRVSNDIIIEL